MKPFTWARWRGERVVLCGPLKLCWPIVAAFRAHPECPLFICDDEFAHVPGVVEGATVIASEELSAFHNDITILVGKTFYQRYRHFLSYEGMADFYSATPLIEDGRDKAVYYNRFAPRYRREHAGLYFGGLEVVVTPRCTLRCRDCANLIQYYTGPQDPSPETVVAASKRLLQVIDGVAVFKILGGEPLLAQETIRGLLALPELGLDGKALGVQIPTNGTLLFDNETLAALAANPLSCVILSNYGKTSRKEEALKAQLREAGVAFAETDAGSYWVQMGDPRVPHVAPEHLAEHYRRCDMKDSCCTILNGALYPCPRAAHGEALGFYPPGAGRRVALLGPEEPEALRAALAEQYACQEPLVACCACDNGTMIRVARGVQ